MTLCGELWFPGDKSLSHRAALFAALVKGTTRIHNFLEAEDTLATLRAVENFGITVTKQAEGDYILDAAGSESGRKRELVIDVGNSGTGARLLLGLLAGAVDVKAELRGDESLARRPMQRVIEPLEECGASIESIEADGYLPLKVEGRQLEPIVFNETIGSAQVKSALLLAAVSSNVTAAIQESKPSRNHTENMLSFMGTDIKVTSKQNVKKIDLCPPYELQPRAFDIWGDVSSAAFFVVLALLAPEVPHGIVIRNVLLNEYRSLYLEVLRNMGACIEVLPQPEKCGETGGDLVVYASELKGIEIPADWIPGIIDELPILTIAGLFAQGEFSFRGARELRYKESDRIAALVSNIQKCTEKPGIAEELDDGLIVRGQKNLSLSGTVESYMDHRIVMAFEIAKLVCSKVQSGPPLTIEGREWVKTSFPSFFEALEMLQANDTCGIENATRTPIVITVDGPAGSGKSSLASRLAADFPLYQVDSGALYRTLTYQALQYAARNNISMDDVVKTNDFVEYLQAHPFQVSFEANGRQLVHLNGEILSSELRTPEVTNNIAPIADSPGMRDVVNEKIKTAGRHYSLVADGRDMGTVVFPQASLKFFLTASVEERARRRLVEFQARDHSITYEEVKATIKARDEQDQNRKIGALKPATDAIFIDTTSRSQDVVYQILESYLKNHTF